MIKQGKNILAQKGRKYREKKITELEEINQKLLRENKDKKVIETGLNNRDKKRHAKTTKKYLSAS